MGCVDQLPECGFAIGELTAGQNPLDGFSTEIARGDRRVGANSEQALVVARRHCGEQLTFARRYRTGVSHHRLRELEQMLGARRIVSEEMPQIRLPIGLGRRVFEMRDEHAGKSAVASPRESR